MTRGLLGGALLSSGSVLCFVLSALACSREAARPPRATSGPAPENASSLLPNGAADAAAAEPAPANVGEPPCEAGEAEICGCPRGQSGVRRCKADGSGYGACDGCADDTVCGGRACSGMRSDAIGASVPGCCTARGHCGIDVSFFAKNHGYAAGCLELDAPGKTDPACPSKDIALPFGDGKTITLQGCRTRDGACGYDVNLPAIVNLGCTAPPRKLPSE